MNKLLVSAKAYILVNVIISVAIFYSVLNGNYEVSLARVVPFIIFGGVFELFRLSAFSVKDQQLTISAGAAIIMAAVILFNPLELIIFATCYGVLIVIFPRVASLNKAVFNIVETINVTYLSYIVWHWLHNNTDSLLDPTNVIPLLITMLVFVIVDFLAVLTIVALASESNVFRTWKESFDWILVSYGLVAFIGLILAAVYQTFYIYGLVGFVIPLLLMRYTMYLFVKDKEKQFKQLQDFNKLLEANNEQLIFMLSQVIDIRDNSLFGHSSSVAKYATAIGEKLGLSTEQMYDLQRGSLLHDIGKLGISEEILQKPGKLTDEEFTTVKKHTLIGQKMIEKVKGMEKAAKIIGQHHEYFNGMGYPNRLQDEDILIESRIVSLCDALDTMISTRPYKREWTLDEATSELLRCSGTQFDPRVVSAFLELKDEKGEGFFVNSALTQDKDSNLNESLQA